MTKPPRSLDQLLLVLSILLGLGLYTGLIRIDETTDALARGSLYGSTCCSMMFWALLWSILHMADDTIDINESTSGGSGSWWPSWLSLHSSQDSASDVGDSGSGLGDGEDGG